MNTSNPSPEIGPDPLVDEDTTVANVAVPRGAAQNAAAEALAVNDPLMELDVVDPVEEFATSTGLASSSTTPHHQADFTESQTQNRSDKTGTLGQVTAPPAEQLGITSPTSPTSSTSSIEAAEVKESTSRTVAPIVGSNIKGDFDRQSRRSFLVFSALAVGGFSGFRWLQSTSTVGGVHWPLRKALNASSSVQRAVFGDSATVATHAKSEAREVRRNGSEGVKTPLGPNDTPRNWIIEVQRNGIRMGALKLADLAELPQVEQTVDHKCVEGWSQIVTWKGIRMADVLAKAEELVEGKRAEHVGFATPDKGYYVTLERSAIKHPQTLLALSLNGEELTDKHGAPCRLAVPTRYGIKSIKRLGIINLSDAPASDYWGQRGYDLYAAF
jgi:Oxidoreductase molybdopterin binding domain